MKIRPHFQGLRRYGTRLSLLFMLVTMMSGTLHGQTEAEITIGVVPGALKFNLTSFEVHTETNVTVIFNNNGLMQHNILFVKPGKADEIMNLAMAMGAGGLDKDWIPNSDDIIGKIPLIDAGKTYKTVFRSPSRPGEYPYICTFPGHGIIMRGIMTVKEKGAKLKTPKATQSEKIKLRNNLEGITYTNRPSGTPSKPFLIRTYMPDPGVSETVFKNHGKGLVANKYSPNVGDDVEGKVPPIDGIPAAFGISYGKALSVCWDTTECRILYLWKDGFLNMDAYWGGNGGGGRKSFDYVPRLEGTIQFKAEGPHPLRIGGMRVTPHFSKVLLKKNIPYFYYDYGGAEIQESLQLTEDGKWQMYIRLAATEEQPLAYKLPSQLVQHVISVNGKAIKKSENIVLRCEADHKKSFIIVFANH